MINTHCKTKHDHYWGVGQTTKPNLEQMVKAGIPRRSSSQRLRHCQDSVLLLVGAGWEQVQITLTAEEARWIAEDPMAKAAEVEKRELGKVSRKQIARAMRTDRDDDRAAKRVRRKQEEE